MQLSDCMVQQRNADQVIALAMKANYKVLCTKGTCLFQEKCTGEECTEPNVSTPG